MITLKQLKEGSLRSVAGACPNTEDFLGLVNESVRRLLDRGSWWGTVQKIQVCSYGGCITWPRFVGTVLAMNVCKGVVPVSNYWYEFQPWNGGDASMVCNNGLSRQAISDSTSPVFNPIQCGEKYIRAYCDCPQDYGKEITIFGVDENGQEIKQQVNGEWISGYTLTLQTPYASTPFQVREIQRVVKDVTQCPVRLFQYDATNDVLLNCAYYEPTEETPMYRHMVVRQFNGGCREVGSVTNCEGIKQITALIKMEYIPIVADTDWVIIDCEAAIKFMVQSIKMAEAEKLDDAVKFELAAVRELNLQLRNKVPQDQIPAIVQSFGSAAPAYHKIGYMV